MPHLSLAKLTTFSLTEPYCNIAPFFMSKYPITQRQWEVLLGDNSCRFKGHNRPVEKVSWYDADDFCRIISRQTRRSYRLPSEAQWEYACRAGTKTPFYFGESITTEVANFNGENYALASKGMNRHETTPVGTFPPNTFGVYDLHGNVWEWCADAWHENYQGAPADGSIWESGQHDAPYLLRGGSWQVNPRDCRCAFRRRHNPREKNEDIGFRVVIS
ncbi:formylglycine-generating enzyme family protein [Merismopedia glauca]|uniref:Formylglycine-generating enzyme family protein n=1 Tax=Merismopedia glauca CCAP 1448/3 TaxID=1296344 RepID=A0A2T1C7C5_9CYAN|nr:formylglycine-generating enzyme family protein [Merismopedia glauca]PSB04159.1 formylglycine-generating enzyme family protein [Merismopedia glauca CCAP 1448/3]